MDTRSKILTPAAAREIAARPIAIALGTFDVLRASHVGELEAARQGAALLAIVLPREGEVLPQRVRAELVAALRSVDFVTLCEAAEADAIIAALQPVQVTDLRDADERRSRELRERIVSRRAIQ